MPTRRTEPAFDAARAMERIGEQMDRQLAMVDAGLDRMSIRLDSIQEAVNKGNLDRDDVRRELSEVQRQLIDTREELQRHKAEQTREAARGAAEGAVSAAVAPAAKEAAHAEAKKLNRPQWYALGGIGLLWVANFFKDGPSIMKGLEAVWHAMTGLAK